MLFVIILILAVIAAAVIRTLSAHSHADPSAEDKKGEK